MATEMYDQARTSVQQFLHARESAEIIFTRGTTEGINLVAASWGRANLSTGDEIIISEMEHHANIVPWQMIAEQTGAILRVIPINDAGELIIEEYQKLLSSRTKIVAVTHLSNSLGTINDVEKITLLAHAVGAKVLIDGAQWVAHHPTDVEKIGCDFYVFSGHKIFGPTGIGVLYGRREILETMPPYQGGGDMIENVTFAKTTYAGIPARFEAGTPNIAGAIGLGAAIEFVRRLNFSYASYEEHLLKYATAQLEKISGLRIVGTAAKKRLRDLIRYGWRFIAGYRFEAGCDKHCRAHRTSLLPAGDGTNENLRHRPDFAGDVQHQRRSGCAGRRPAAKSVLPFDRQARSSTPPPKWNGHRLRRRRPRPPRMNWRMNSICSKIRQRKTNMCSISAIVCSTTLIRSRRLRSVCRGAWRRFISCGEAAPQQPGDDPERFEFIADANADIVRGLIAILQKNLFRPSHQ